MSHATLPRRKLTRIRHVATRQASRGAGSGNKCGVFLAERVCEGPAGKEDTRRLGGPSDWEWVYGQWAGAIPAATIAQKLPVASPYTQGGSSKTAGKGALIPQKTTFYVRFDWKMPSQLRKSPTAKLPARAQHCIRVLDECGGGQ